MTNIQKALSQLKENQALKITPQGASMYPFFYGGRDSLNIIVPKQPLKRGDIALYLRADGTYVIHRVYKVKKTDDSLKYYMIGDNQNWVEGPLEESQIHGLAISIIRKGRMIDCQRNKWYQLLVHIWLILRPVRPILIKARLWMRDRKASS